MTNDIDRRIIQYTRLAADAKRLAHKFNRREDWEQVKDDIMLELLRIKFNQEPLKVLLLSTKEAELIEGNTWGDVYWGVCNGIGQNKLGKLLMQVRSELN